MLHHCSVWQNGQNRLHIGVTDNYDTFQTLNLIGGYSRAAPRQLFLTAELTQLQLCWHGVGQSSTLTQPNSTLRQHYIKVHAKEIKLRRISSTGVAGCWRAESSCNPRQRFAALPNELPKGGS